MSNNMQDLIELIKDKDVLIFDFDGTLINTEKHHLKAHNKVLSEILNRDYEMSVQNFLKYMGRKDTEIFEEYKVDFGVDFDSDEMITKKVLSARDILSDESIKVFDYFETVKNLKGNKRFYIASNQDIRLLKPVLASKGIESYFDDIFCLSKMKVEKTDFYNNITDFIDCSYDKIALFEDSSEVIKLAKSLNITTIGVESDLNAGKLDGLCDMLLKY